MLNASDLHKVWDKHGRFLLADSRMRLTEDGLILGAKTVIVPLGYDDGLRPYLKISGNEERILTLLSIAYGQPVLPYVLDNLQNASRCLSKGELVLAYIHIAFTGLQSLDDTDAPRRLFMAELLLDDGMDEAEMLKGLGLFPHYFTPWSWRQVIKEFNPDQPRDDHGRWTSENGGSLDASQQGEYSAYLTLASDVMAESPRKIGDVDDKTQKRIVDEAASWGADGGTPYAPGPKGENQDKVGSGAQKGVAADCSGSVHAIMEASGVSYDYTASKDFAFRAEKGSIPFRELGVNETPQPGDVVLYPGHMAIYTGNGSVWSARKPGYNFGEYPVSGYFAGKPRYFRPLRQTSV